MRFFDQIIIFENCVFGRLLFFETAFYLTTLVIKKFNFKGLRLLIAVLKVGANFFRRGQF